MRRGVVSTLAMIRMVFGFGAPVTDSAGKQRAEDLADRGAGLRDHLGRHLPEGRIPFDLEQVLHVNAAHSGDLAQVVPHHIDDHGVFGTILRRLGEPTSMRHILGVRSSPRHGPLHRPSNQRVTIEVKEQFRRCRTDGKPRCIEVRRVIRLLGFDEIQEQGPGVGAPGIAQAEGVVYLVGFAVGDALFKVGDHPFVVGLRDRRTPAIQTRFVAGVRPWNIDHLGLRIQPEP